MVLFCEFIFIWQRRERRDFNQAFIINPFFLRRPLVSPCQTKMCFSGYVSERASWLVCLFVYLFFNSHRETINSQSQAERIQFFSGLEIAILTICLPTTILFNLFISHSSASQSNYFEQSQPHFSWRFLIASSKPVLIKCLTWNYLSSSFQAICTRSGQFGSGRVSHLFPESALRASILFCKFKFAQRMLSDCSFG